MLSIATIQYWEKLVKVVLDSMRMNAQVVPPAGQKCLEFLGMGPSWGHEPFICSNQGLYPEPSEPLQSVNVTILQPSLDFMHSHTIPRKDIKKRILPEAEWVLQAIGRV